MDKSLGKRGEALAQDYLRKKGYQILWRNYRTPFGEMDLVVAQGETLVFLEVKTRSSKRFGLPREAVHFKKQQQYYRLAQHFLQYHPQSYPNTRFDVIEIYALANGQYHIEHIENAF